MKRGRISDMAEEFTGSRDSEGQIFIITERGKSILSNSDYVPCNGSVEF